VHAPAALLTGTGFKPSTERTLERPLHTLRHSYARALRRVEAPLEAVQAALDHSNLATTSIYLRQLEGQEDPWWPKLAAELGLEGGREASPPAEEQR
jgi:integrase